MNTIASQKTCPYASSDALNASRKNTLILLAFAATVIIPALMIALLLSHPATEKRLGAIQAAWASVSPEAADMLTSCLVTRGKGESKLAGSTLLLAHVRDCEDNLQGMAFASSQGLGPQQDLPSHEAVSGAIKAREAVFSRTLLPNPADF